MKRRRNRTEIAYAERKFKDRWYANYKENRKRARYTYDWTEFWDIFYKLQGESDEKS